MKQLYAQTIFKNTEDKQTARSLTILIAASLVVYIVLIFSGFYWRDWALIAVACSGIVLQILTFWLLKRGKVLAASIILVVTSLVIVTVFATVGQGIHDVALVVFPIIFIFAGLTFNRRVLILCIALTIAALGWLVLGQINGWFIPVPFSGTTGWSDFLVTSVILLMAVFSVDLLSSNLRNNLQRLRQEIIKRNNTEEALRESELRYRSLFENMSNGYAYCQMFYKDGHPDDFRYIAVNKAFEKQTGLKDVAGKMVSQVIPGIRESDAELLQLYSRVALTGNNEYFEMFVESLKMWFAVSVYSPQREYFVAIFDVITERKRAEAVISESEKRYKTLFESAAEGILIADIETHQQRYANPTICKMLGYSPEELTKMNVYDIHPKEAREQVNAEFSAQARGEKITSLLPCLKKDGTVIYADVNATKAVIDDRECNIGFFIDVTERVNAEKQIKVDIIEKDALIKKLQDAAAKIDTLSGLIPMCAWCKKIRNDQGYWQGVEQYIGEHSKAEFTHSICADCQKKYFPEIE